MHIPRYRRRERKIVTDLPLTPLIDTALTLLIIFMVTSPMIHNAIKINVPQGNAKDKVMQQTLTICIDKDRMLFLNGQQMALNDLKKELTHDFLYKSDGIICIKADQALQYKDVVEVIYQLTCIEGVAHVALAIKREA